MRKVSGDFFKDSQILYFHKFNKLSNESLFCMGYVSVRTNTIPKLQFNRDLPELSTFISVAGTSI